MASDTIKKSKRLHQMIGDANTIAIIGHIHPDGDCIGSTMAMYNYIIDNYEGKSIQVYAEEFSPDFMIINGTEKINHTATDKRYDLAISLDVSTLERMGDFRDIYNSAISTICIDHHVSNEGFGDLCYVSPNASSACEALCDLIDLEKVSLNTATSLFLGIVHDTGVFRYSCTGRRTMELAGLFMSMGVNSEQIIDDTFFKKTRRQNLLGARVMTESKLLLDNRLIFGIVTSDLFEEMKCTKMDTDGIVEQLRQTDGVEVSLFAYQLSDKKFKYSLRAKAKVDVNKVATTFGGGGHVKAAGFESEKPYEEVLATVAELVKAQLDG